MKKIVLAAAAVVALSGCGDSRPNTGALQNAVGAAVDEQTLVVAIDQSIDRNAAKDVARAAVVGAIRDVVPTAELRAVGVVIDEKALAEGIDKAVDGNALGDAIRNTVKGQDVQAK